MIHPDTELRPISAVIGFGVFATRRIPKGTVTWVLDALDFVMPSERAEQLPRGYQAIFDRYCFRDSDGNQILCWDFARYMNHSCDPTTLSIGALCDIAARDIEEGEQLTCEYALLNMPDMQCMCGSPRCRGRVRAEELPKLAPAIDAATKLLAPLIPKVGQPLMEFMLPQNRDPLMLIAAGKAPVPSCMENHLG